MDHDAVGAGEGDGVAQGLGPYGDEVGARTRHGAGGGQAHHVARPRGHGFERGVGGEVSGADEQRRGLQVVAATDRVEGVADVVGSRRDAHAGRLQAIDRCDSAGDGVIGIPSLQVQVGDRQGDDADVGGAHLVGEGGEVGLGHHAQAHAVTRRAGAGRAGDRAGVGGEGVGAGEALVGMQVEADVTPPREGDETLEVGDRVVGEVRCAADQVDPGDESGLEDRVGDRRAAEGDEFDVHQADELVAQSHEGAHAGQGVIAAQQVDVRADGGDPGCQHPQRRRAGPAQRVVLVEGQGEGVPALDRAFEVSEGRPDGIPRLRLVEVGVGFRSRGGEQVARQVEDDAVGVGQGAAGRHHREHLVAVERDVDDGARGQAHAAQCGDRDGWNGGHGGLRETFGRGARGVPRQRGGPPGAAASVLV